MKYLITAAIIVSGVTTAGFAQTMSSGSNNPAVKDPSIHTTIHSAKGRNSFTESQAQGRIAKAGYTGVGKLSKNHEGVWQGKAMKDGKPVMVMLDYKGDVSAR